MLVNPISGRVIPGRTEKDPFLAGRLSSRLARWGSIRQEARAENRERDQRCQRRDEEATHDRDGQTDFSICQQGRMHGGADFMGDA